MKSEPLRGGERFDQIVPDLAPALVIVPPPEMQIGFQRQFDGASDEMKEDFARVRIVGALEVLDPGEELNRIVEEIPASPAPQGAARPCGRMTGLMG
ncbi:MULTISPECIES: hypothetical protein [Hyphomicrobiales]|uniref:hypothetical protein n=1 Tax=Xanthobacter autotrophicus TaxID=280 RepID=UPI00372B9FCD